MDDTVAVKRIFTMMDLKEGWERIGRTYFLVENKKTKERIIVKGSKVMRYLVPINNREWEILQHFIDNKAVEILYEESFKNKKNGD